MLSVSGYRIDSEVYKSERTVVYRGERLHDGRRVVLKTLGSARDPSEAARLRYEFRVASSLQVAGVYVPVELLHDGFVAVFDDFGGESLAFLRQQGALSLIDTLRIGAAVARILADVHRCQVVHKDVNPANIVLNRATGGVQLIDFGIASLVPKESDALKSTAALEGTLGYLAPEQTGRMNRSLDYRSDLYGLGATLYDLLTGRPPHQAPDLPAFVHAVLALAPTPPVVFDATIPPTVSRIILKLLAKDPSARYQSGHGLAHDLERCMHHLRADGQVPELTLAEQDRSEVFSIPDRLYGREAEIAQLMSCYETARRGHGTTVLLAGPSGVGKSALVNELSKPIAEANGVFAVGKFDQFTSHMPYSALSEALTRVVKHILAQPERQVEAWRARARDAVGSLGKLVTRAFPATELLLGACVEPPAAPPAQAQERFKYTMGRFVRALASPDAPLTVFLDDMQWADTATLDLVVPITADRDSGGLLVICAYRDKEVPAGHPFALVCKELREKRLVGLEVQTTPMDVDAIAALVRDTLRSDARDARELATFLQEKTGGVAFFVRELLRHLYVHDLLQYEPQRDRWVWNMAALAAAQVSNNVAELLLTRLAELPEDTRRSLGLAAFLGNAFDLQMLALIADTSAASLAACLQPAIVAGIVVPASPNYRYAQDSGAQSTLRVAYKFAHDRLHEVAFNLSAPAEHASLHLRIGRLLLRHADAHVIEPSERATLTSQALEHMNSAMALIDDPAEQRALALRNIEVGMTAIAASAFSNAVRFLRPGLALIGDAWASDYEVMRKALMALSECEFVGREVDAALSSLGTVYAHSRSALDQARVLAVKVRILIACGRPIEAVETSLVGLAHLGVRLKRRPSVFWVAKHFLALKPAIRRLDLRTLHALPVVADESLELALNLLTGGVLAGALSDRLFHIIAIFKSSELLANKRNSWLASVLGAQAAVLSALGDIKLALHAYRMFEAVLDLYPERRHDNALSTLAITNLALPFELSWPELRHHARTWLKETAASGHVFERASFAVNSVHMANACNVPMEEIELEIADNLQFVSTRSVAEAMMVSRQANRMLAGRTLSPHTLSDADYDEQARFAELSQIREYDMWQSHYWSLKTMGAFVHRDFDASMRYAHQAYHAIARILYMVFWGADAYLYAGLSALMQQRPTLRDRYLLFKSRRHLRHYAKNGPVNFAGHPLLLEAQVAAHRGQTEKAMRWFELAIDAFSTRSQRLTAVANECAARFYAQQGLEALARTHMRAAYDRYGKWGAAVKVRALRDEFPYLATSARKRSGAATGTARSSKNAVDFSSLIKASQELSAQIDPNRLLGNMLALLIENAGADAGALALYEPAQRGFTLKAASKGDKHWADASGVTRIDATPEVPATVMQYAERTREAVVLDDAEQSSFGRDPYVAAAHPKSVLCYPVRRGDTTVALVYLENSLVTGAFTPERQQVLTVLTAQVATSLENAGFYQDLESKVAQRTRALEAAQQRMVELERAAVETRMAGGFAQRIRDILEPAAAALAPAAIGDIIARYSAACETVATAVLTGDTEATRRERAGLARLIEDHDFLAEAGAVAGDSLRRGLRIADAILQFAADRPRSTVGVVNVADVVTTVLRQEAERIAQHHVAVHIESAPSAPALGDDEHWRIILANTVANALDALARQTGPLDVERTLRVQIANVEDRVQVRIADNGPGMDASVQARIFEPFFSTNPTQRIGLGLPLVRRLLALYDGRIQVDSEPSRGTQMIISVPRAG